MRRLFHKVYLTIIASLVMVVVVAGAIRLGGWDVSPAGFAFEMAGELLAADLPPADAPRSAQQQAIAQLARRLGIDLSLYINDPDRLRLRRAIFDRQVLTLDKATLL